MPLDVGKYMKKVTKKSKSGLTLVELIVSSALLTLVLAVAFAALLFGQRTFRGGSTQSAIQADLRLASDVIRDETRYASDLQILDDLQVDAMDADKSYIYLSADGKTLWLVVGGGAPQPIIDYTETPNTMDVAFSKDTLTGNAIGFSKTIAGDRTSENVLHYSLQAQAAAQNKTYKLDSNVILLNFKSRPPNLSAIDPPLANPMDGEVPMGTVVTLTASPGFLIYYTLNGSDPTMESALDYAATGPISLTGDAVLKAIAVKADGTEASSTAVYRYTISSGPTPTEPGPQPTGTPTEPEVPTPTATPTPPPTIQPPVASNLTLNAKNNPKSGDPVTAVYTYTQSDGVPQGASMVEWFSREADGSDVRSELISYYVPGTGQNFKLTLTDAMRARTVYFEVTPIAQADASSPAVAGAKQVSPTINVHKNA